MQHFAALRQIASPQCLPVLNAAMLAGKMMTMCANRALYVAKCDDAEAQCDGSLGSDRRGLFSVA